MVFVNVIEYNVASLATPGPESEPDASGHLRVKPIAFAFSAFCPKIFAKQKRGKTELLYLGDGKITAHSISIYIYFRNDNTTLF